MYVRGYLQGSENGRVVTIDTIWRPFWFAMAAILNLVYMATAAKFVQPIPIFLAYLVPLDVNVVPIKFHQLLFGE
jgi:hypothetical protein